MKITKAILLAAGFGTRLRPLTNDLPKPLLPLNGFTSLEYGLHFLKRGGIEDVVINLHHHGDKIKAHVGDGQRYGLRVTYSEEKDILDTGGGVKQAAARATRSVISDAVTGWGSHPPTADGGGSYPPEVVTAEEIGRKRGNRDAAYVVLNSVVLIDCDLQKVIDHHFTQKADATMVLRKAEPNDNFTRVAVDREGWIKGFGKEGDLFYTGLQIIGPKLLDILPPAGTASCMIKQGYEPLISQAGRVASFLHDGYWNKVETFDRYEQIKKDIAAGRVGTLHSTT